MGDAAVDVLVAVGETMTMGEGFVKNEKLSECAKEIVMAVRYLQIK